MAFFRFSRLSLWVPVLFVLAAFTVRAHWNLVVHPLGDYLYSDMHGYVRRAQALMDFGIRPREYSAFYPYGTHMLVVGVFALFGRDNLTAVGIVYAALGAGIVGFSYGIARQVSRSWVIPMLTASFFVAYYPLISLGGYVLSEVPFGFFLTAMTYFVLRLIESGRRRDAVAAGIAMALGAVIRPQMLLSAALLGVVWGIARVAAPRVGLRRLVYVAVPLVVVLAFSAARVHYHTGRYGLISENGQFNQVFGRCHNTGITAMPTAASHRRTSFGPPPLGQLEARATTRPGEFPQLDPAIGTGITYRGYIGDRTIHDDLIRRCVAATGLIKQVEYSVVHLLMLWRYNIPWPDSGNSEWRQPASYWGIFVANTFAIPGLLGLLVVFRPRKRLGEAIVAVHGWALLAVAALYFGDPRLRAPYDPLFFILAAQTLAWIADRVRPTLARIKIG